jgi:cytochrome b6-f complex iron-sulfur subunit
MTTTNPTRHTPDAPDDAIPVESPPRSADSWREALGSRRTELALPETVPATQAAPLDRDLSRRRFIRASFWTGLGVSFAGSIGLMADFLYPRNVAGFGGAVPTGNVQDFPAGGEPQVFVTGSVYVVNLDPAETRAGGSAGGRGLLALWWKCPHLGCTVPWRSTFEFDGDAGGWYRCPCHGSTFTKSGVRVFGPAPRSMDTMVVEIDDAGNITVQTGQISSGGPDNPERAVSHPLLPGSVARGRGEPGSGDLVAGVSAEETERG